MSVEEYRAIDIALFSVLLIVSETVIITAATRWFPGEPYTVSVTAAITAIVMMRWGAWAAIHAALGGFVLCFVSGGTVLQYMIYCAGNLLSLGALLFIRLFGSENIRRDSFKSLVFALLVLLLMQLGRAGTAVLFGTSIADAAGFVMTDTLSALFTLVIVWIVRRLDGVFENQKHYLLRVQKELREERFG